MIYGYARVSTKGQARDGNGLEAQTEMLRAAGAAEIFEESYTGKNLHRPELDRLLDKISAGDTVIVCKLDRVARTVKDGIEIIERVVDKGCGLHILNMGMFDNTPTGRLMRNVLLAFAEFERDMIIQRTSEGKSIAKQNPEYREGRPTLNVTREQIEGLRVAGLSVSEICEKFGMCKRSYYNVLKRHTVPSL